MVFVEYVMAPRSWDVVYYYLLLFLLSLLLEHERMYSKISFSLLSAAVLVGEEVVVD